MSVVAVIGSRTYPTPEDVRRVIAVLQARGPVQIISGGAPGVDTFVREACRDLGFHFCQEDPDPHGLEHVPLPHHFYEFRADWRPNGKYNPRAGFERNGEIVRHSTRVIAFLAPGKPTAGTSDTIAKAKAAGLPVSIFHEGQWDAATPSAPVSVANRASEHKPTRFEDVESHRTLRTPDR